MGAAGMPWSCGRPTTSRLAADQAVFAARRESWPSTASDVDDQGKSEQSQQRQGGQHERIGVVHVSPSDTATLASCRWLQGGPIAMMRLPASLTTALARAAGMVHSFGPSTQRSVGSGLAVDDMKPIDADQKQVWSLLPGRKYVRLQLPPLPVEGLPTPINIHLDFDAGTVDEMLDRLTILRAQMLPKLPAAKKRN